MFVHIYVIMCLCFWLDGYSPKAVWGEYPQTGSRCSHLSIQTKKTVYRVWRNCLLLLDIYSVSELRVKKQVFESPRGNKVVKNCKKLEKKAILNV